jgi:hypothetical protein
MSDNRLVLLYGLDDSSECYDSISFVLLNELIPLKWHLTVCGGLNATPVTMNSFCVGKTIIFWTSCYVLKSRIHEVRRTPNQSEFK